jgi:hypothetical protein
VAATDAGSAATVEPHGKTQSEPANKNIIVFFRGAASDPELPRPTPR